MRLLLCSSLHKAWHNAVFCFCHKTLLFLHQIPLICLLHSASHGVSIGAGQVHSHRRLLLDFELRLQATTARNSLVMFLFTSLQRCLSGAEALPDSSALFLFASSLPAATKGIADMLPEAQACTVRRRTLGFRLAQTINSLAVAQGQNKGDHQRNQQHRHCVKHAVDNPRSTCYRSQVLSAIRRVSVCHRRAFHAVCAPNRSSTSSLLLASGRARW